MSPKGILFDKNLGFATEPNKCHQIPSTNLYKLGRLNPNFLYKPNEKWIKKEPKFDF